MTDVRAGHIYDVTRPDGTGFRFNVTRIKGRWVHGRASGGYVGSILITRIGPFFTFVEVTE